MEVYAEIIKYIDKDSGEPLYRQIANAVCSAVESGVIPHGSKLPPIRKLSEALSVNNVTIVNAYKLLESKKVAYSITGSGTYISEPEIGSFTPVSIQEGGKNGVRQSGVPSGAFNFAKGSVSPELFPVDEFKVLFNYVLQRDKGNAFGYEQSLGYEPLRSNLCKYLETFGIKTSGDKLQIISGAQQGVDVVSKALLYPQDNVLTENPTYYGAIGAFMSRGANVYGIPVQNNGIDMDKLLLFIKTHRPKLVYIMTYYQTPACITYSIEKKRGLIELAAKYDFYIIEEDNQSDFNYSRNPVVPLKALDYKNRVIYIKSFSKLLMPGLRLGFMLLPKPVLSKILSAKYITDIDTSGFLQRAFSLFIETGGWDKHISAMRSVFKKRYETLTACLNSQIRQYIPFEEPSGGLSIWCKIPENETSSADFAQKLAASGIIVTPGDIFALHDTPVRNIRMSFADIDEKGIIAGAERLYSVLSAFTDNA